MAQPTNAPTATAHGGTDAAKDTHKTQNKHIHNTQTTQQHTQPTQQEKQDKDKEHTT